MSEQQEIDDLSHQKIDDLINKGIDQQIKFIYGMISIALGTLALSFQFSIKLQAFPGYLITSWIVLFISVLLGGWRIYILPTHFFSNANLLEHRRSVKKYSVDGLEKDLSKAWSNVTEECSKIDKMSTKAILVFKAQIAFLVAGLFLLGLFTTLNYLFFKH